jgi:hypothetical protein
MMTTIVFASAQIVNNGVLKEITLKDGLKVNVVPGFDASGAHMYYYFPVSLRLATRSEQPEFSFMRYATTTGKDDISGAILNFLIVWGLTPDQEKELENLLKTSLDSLAVMAGAVSTDVPQDSPGFCFSGKNQLTEILQTKINSQPVVPVFPGTKMAFSYRLNSKEADLFENAVQNPEILDSINMELKFQFHGGIKSLWWNQFHQNTYVLKTSLKEVLSKAIPSKTRSKKNE